MCHYSISILMDISLSHIDGTIDVFIFVFILLCGTNYTPPIWFINSPIMMEFFIFYIVIADLVHLFFYDILIYLKEKTQAISLGLFLCLSGNTFLLLGIKQLMAGGGVALIGTTLVPLLSGLFG